MNGYAVFLLFVCLLYIRPPFLFLLLFLRTCSTSSSLARLVLGGSLQSKHRRSVHVPFVTHVIEHYSIPSVLYVSDHWLLPSLKRYVRSSDGHKDAVVPMPSSPVSANAYYHSSNGS